MRTCERAETSYLWHLMQTCGDCGDVKMRTWEHTDMLTVEQNHLLPQAKNVQLFTCPQVRLKIGLNTALWHEWKMFPGGKNYHAIRTKQECHYLCLVFHRFPNLKWDKTKIYRLYCPTLRGRKPVTTPSRASGLLLCVFAAVWLPLPSSGGSVR